MQLGRLYLHDAIRVRKRRGIKFKRALRRHWDDIFVPRTQNPYETTRIIRKATP